MAVAKPFNIPKKLVWEAYQQVRSKGEAPGVDGQTIEEFEKDLKGNLYRVWNRMSSGTYFPKPIRRMLIPKASGGTRPLGIPAISDRIAQTVAKMVLEPIVEPQFHPDSYGYRPGKSALDAVARARQRCWDYDWTLDIDVRAFFDSLDHQLVMRAVRKYTTIRWILLYVERWLKAPILLEDGSLRVPDAGTPQGGVISPVVANVFLHLAFDQWMQDHHSSVPFERYADDVLVHCRTEREAKELLSAITRRFTQCRLTVHPEKSKIVYSKDSNRTGHAELYRFDFLGYTFRPRRVRNSRDGRYFASFSPAISDRAKKLIRTTMRRNWRIRQRTDKSIQDLANMFNPILRGWIHYYGRFRRSSLRKVFKTLDFALVKWATRKYKRLRGHRTRASEWLERMIKQSPALFAHWGLRPECA